MVSLKNFHSSPSLSRPPRKPKLSGGGLLHRLSRCIKQLVGVVTLVHNGGVVLLTRSSIPTPACPSTRPRHSPFRSSLLVTTCFKSNLGSKLLLLAFVPKFRFMISMLGSCCLAVGRRLFSFSSRLTVLRKAKMGTLYLCAIRRN